MSFVSNAATFNGGSKNQASTQQQGISPSNSICQFNNETQILLKNREQSSVQLTFSPRHQMQYNGLVKIENVSTGQLLEYEVVGIGEEPLAETVKLTQNTLECKKYEI